MLHDRAEDGGLQMLPLALALGDADEVGAEEHALDAVDLEQARGERRVLALGRIGEFQRPLVEHGPPRDEFQGGGIWRSFGLDEHGPFSCNSPVSVPLPNGRGRRRTRPTT